MGRKNEGKKKKRHLKKQKERGRTGGKQ
jgi:hypothetical protein